MKCFSFCKVLLAYILCLPLYSASQTFIPQGPAPSDFSIFWGPGNTSPGAVEAIAPSPIDINTIFISGPNGGIWRTTDFGKSWTPLTDTQASLSISSIVFDPSDTTANTLLAGVGVTSNGLIDFLERGGLPAGVFRTTDGGNTWTNPGSGTINDLNINSVFANGSFMLAGGFDPTETVGTGSLYKSTDTGATFIPISVSGNIGSEPVTAIKTPPGDSNKIYVAITRTVEKLDTALYQTINQGTSFTPIFTSVNSNGIINTNSQTVLKVATGPNGAIAVGIVDTQDTTLGPENDRLVGIFLSLDAGATWDQLDLSTVNSVCDQGDCGFNPTGQGVNNSFLTIDPVDPTIVYAGGSYLATSPTSALGLWKLQLSGTTTISTNLTVAANDTMLHPDIREMFFSGPIQNPSERRLLISTDGGLSSRTQDANPAWVSINGNTPSSNLSLFESYSSTYDANNNLIMTGAQDGSVNLQNQNGSQSFKPLQLLGDGLNAIVNDKTSNAISYYYSSLQFLGALNRLTLPVVGTASQTLLNFAGDEIDPYFFSLIKLNKIDPTKMAFGAEGVWIAKDDLVSDTLDLTLKGADPEFATFMSYGTLNNPDALIACTFSDIGSHVYFTEDASTTDLSLTNYFEGAQTDIVFDLRDSERFFITDGTTPDVWYTKNHGDDFSSLKANLTPLDIVNYYGLDFISTNSVNAVLVSGLSQTGSPIAVADSDAGGNLTGWRLFGTGIPHTPVSQLEYNPKSDSLLATAYGRGIWQMYDVTSNFPSASVLQFGLANNDSTPDIDILTNGNYSSRNLIKYGTGTLNITGIPQYATPGGGSGTTTVTNGSLINNGDIQGQVFVDGANAILSGTGFNGPTFVTNGASIRAGNSIGTFTFASLDLDPGTHILNEFNPTQSSLIQVTGTASVNSDVILIQVPGTYPYEGLLTFLTAADVTGSVANPPIGGMPGFLFDIIQRTNGLDLHWTRFMVLDGITGNALKFGNYINTYGLFSEAQRYLSVLSGNDLNNALNKASSARNSIPIFVTDNNTFTFSNALTNHFSEVHYERMLPDCCCERGPCCCCCERDPCCKDNAIWIDVFANFASQDSQAQIPKFHFNTEGVILGYDRFCRDSWTYGIAVGYAHDNYHVHNHSGSGNVNTVFVAPYTTFYCCDFFIEGELLYAYNWIENKRKISFPDFLGTAKGKFHTDQLMPHLGFGYDFCCYNTFFEPFATFDWVINWHDGFREHGSIPFNVKQKSHTSSMLRSELGLRAYRGWNTCNGDLIVRAVVGYVNKAPFQVGEVTSTIIDFPASVTFRSFKHNQNLGTWGISAMLKNSCGYFGMITYDGEAGSGYLANGFQLKFGMEF